MNEFEKFKRRTGIKDVKLDTFTQLRDKWNKEHPPGYTTTTACIDEVAYIDKDVIEKLWDRMRETREDFKMRYFGDWAPHQKQRESFEHEIDPVRFDEDVYDAEWEYAQKKLPE